MHKFIHFFPRLVVFDKENGMREMRYMCFCEGGLSGFQRGRGDDERDERQRAREAATVDN